MIVFKVPADGVAQASTSITWKAVQEERVGSKAAVDSSIKLRYWGAFVTLSFSKKYKNGRFAGGSRRGSGQLTANLQLSEGGSVFFFPIKNTGESIV